MERCQYLLSFPKFSKRAVETFGWKMMHVHMKPLCNSILEDNHELSHHRLKDDGCDVDVDSHLKSGIEY